MGIRLRALVVSDWTGLYVLYLCTGVANYDDQYGTKTKGTCSRRMNRVMSSIYVLERRFYIYK